MHTKDLTKLEGFLLKSKDRIYISSFKFWKQNLLIKSTSFILAMYLKLNVFQSRKIKSSPSF